MCKVLYYLFARQLIEKKRPFFLAIGFAEVCLYYVTIVYDLIRFQNDLVILASSKNFDNRLRNVMLFFLFSRDFVLAFSGLFFSIYIQGEGIFL